MLGGQMSFADCVEREHLFAHAAQSDVLRSSACPGPAGSAGLPGHRQHPARLQPGVPGDLRVVGTGHVPVRARADRQRAGRVRRRPVLRLLPLPAEPVSPHPDAVVAVDPAGVVRLPPLRRPRIALGAGRRRGGVRGAGALDRLLPLLLRAGPGRLRDLGAGVSPTPARLAGMGRGKRGRGGRARRHAAVPAAVRRGAGAVRLHPAVRRGAPLFRGPARLPQRALSPPFLGRAAHAVAAAGRRPVRGRRAAAAGHRGSDDLGGARYANRAGRRRRTPRRASVSWLAAWSWPARCWRWARSSSS